MEKSIRIKEIRELARRFTPDEIEDCISQQLQEGKNLCEAAGPADQVIDELAKAEFVRTMVERGTPLWDAVRELARRIRQVQEGPREEREKE